MNTLSLRRLPNEVLAILLAVTLFSSVAMGSESAAPTPPMPSKEMREKMASMHERMATCLRSEKPFAECRDEMMKSCQQLSGENGCPMMGMGMHGKMKGPPHSKP
jgi:hypothetical protein